MIDSIKCKDISTKDYFIDITRKYSKKYLESYIKSGETTIFKNVHLNSPIESKEKNNISIIASFGLFQKILNKIHNSSFVNNQTIMICKNSYNDIDVDIYFQQAKNLLSQSKFSIDKLNKKEDILAYDEESNDKQTDDLLDDLIKYLD